MLSIKFINIICTQTVELKPTLWLRPLWCKSFSYDWGWVLKYASHTKDRLLSINRTDTIKYGLQHGVMDVIPLQRVIRKLKLTFILIKSINFC